MIHHKYQHWLLIHAVMVLDAVWSRGASESWAVIGLRSSKSTAACS
jgi:hypothetical protein